MYSAAYSFIFPLVKTFDHRTADLLHPLAIEASAGTGKTYNIENLTLRLITEEIFGKNRPLNLSEILIITFTERAARELSERIRNNMIKERELEKKKTEPSLSKLKSLEKALSDYDFCSISTIHAFCRKTLSEFALEHGMGFDQELFPENLLKESIYDFWRMLPMELTEFKAFMSVFGSIEKSIPLIRELLREENRARMVPSLEEIEKKRDEKSIAWKVLFRLLNKVRELVEVKKMRTNRIGFEDMIQKLHHALFGAQSPTLLKGLRNKYKFCLLDESQDTDHRQWEILKKIFMNSPEEHNLILVGDPKQSIFKFRGADLQMYLAAKQEIGHVESLNVNFRSTPLLMEGINRLLCLKPLFSTEGGISYQPAKTPQTKSGREVLQKEKSLLPPIEFIQLPENLKIGEARQILGYSIALKILDLLGEGFSLLPEDRPSRKISLSDIVILCHKNSECLEIQEILEQHGLPSIITKQEGLFASREAKDTLKLIEAIHLPGDAGKLRLALNTVYFGMTFEEISLLPDPELERLQAALYRMRETFTDHGFSRMFRNFLSEFRVLERNLEKINGERTVTNIQSLFHALGELHSTKSVTLPEMALTMKQLEEDNSDETRMRIDRDGGAVKIMTIHTSKGLEFPIVFLGGSIFQRHVPHFYTFNESGIKVIDLWKGETGKKNHQTEEKEEFKRLLYVALTRAKTYMVLPLFSTQRSNHISLSDLLWPEAYSLKDRIQFLKSEENSALFSLSYAESVTEGTRCYLPEQTKQVKLKSRLNHSNFLAQSLSLTSFSDLTRSRHTDHHDPSFPSLNESPMENLLPPGRETGEMLHSILELLNFEDFGGGKDSLSKQDQDRLLHCMKKYDIDVKFVPSAETLLLHTLNATISLPSGKQFHLFELKKTLKESEFLFPLKKAGLVRFRHALDESLELEEEVRIESDFFKGFIDLIFEYEGRYYIADWKSNFLGFEKEDYSQENLKKDILKHAYFLQYHFYTLALIKLLKKHLANFDYERDFGGIFYFYLRGMRNGEGSGIYFNRPTSLNLKNFASAILGETLL